MKSIDLPDKQLLDAAPDAMVVIDESGEIVLVNQATESLFGYSRNELMGQKIEILVPERFRSGHETHRGKFISALRTRRMGESLELYGSKKDNTEFAIEISLSPVQSAQGLFVAAAMRDVTMQKQLEASLTGILEKSLNEIYVFDAFTLKFIQVNEGARNNLGYSMAELGHLTPVDIKPDYTQEQFEAAIRPLLFGNINRLEFYTTHQRKNGTKYPVEVHIQSMVLESKPVFAAIVLDITERKKAQEQERLIQSTADAIYGTDPEGLCTFCNQSLLTLLGFEKESDLIGKNMHDLIHHSYPDGSHYPADQCRIFQSLSSNTACHVEEEVFWRADGSAVQVEYSSHPMTEDGRVIGCVVSASDITERQTALKLLRESKEIAENATATKSRFLAAASHDLRQPLQSIGLYLSVLDRVVADQPNKALEISTKIRSSLDVMSELLEALLDISKLDAGTVTAEKVDFQLQNLFDQLGTDNRPHAESKGLSLTIESTTSTVHTDPSLLQRILSNFVSNAIRYTNTGSIRVSCKSDNGQLAIEVTDTGPGIPEAAIDNIFEEYFQLDNPVRNRNQGLGLGLSIVKHISRILEHDLIVRSRLDIGSTFGVIVPLAETAAFETVTSLPKNTASNVEHAPIVLLIDDDEAIVDATTMLLESAGFLIYSALDSTEALAHLTQGIVPDVIVSDYRLPGMNGVELIQKVRETLQVDLPSVLMTGDTASKEIGNAQLPQCTLLHKPVNTDQLISLIDRLTS